MPLTVAWCYTIFLTVSVCFVFYDVSSLSFYMFSTISQFISRYFYVFIIVSLCFSMFLCFSVFTVFAVSCVYRVSHWLLMFLTVWSFCVFLTGYQCFSLYSIMTLCLTIHNYVLAEYIGIIFLEYVILEYVSWWYIPKHNDTSFKLLGGTYKFNH